MGPRETPACVLQPLRSVVHLLVTSVAAVGSLGKKSGLASLRQILGPVARLKVLFVVYAMLDWLMQRASVNGVRRAAKLLRWFLSIRVH